MNFARRRPKNLFIQIVPMIDVMFFLVTFFMVFTVFRSETMGLSIQLPKAVTAAKQADGLVVLTISDNGTIHYQDKAVTPEQLLATLRPVIGENHETQVIIKADERVAYRHVVAVMDSVRAVGGYKIALSVERVPQTGTEAAR